MKLRLSYITGSFVLFMFSSCMPPAGGSGDGKSSGSGSMGTMQLVFLGLIMVVFWLFFLRPQAKRAKQQRTFSDTLAKGDKVVTIAGIHGTISKINDDGKTFQLETSPGSYMKIEKSSISMDMTNAANGVTPGKK